MRALAIVTCLWALAITGCGYHTAGSATHLPADVATIDVPIFQSKVTNYHTEVAFTKAVVQQLTSRTKDRVVEGDAHRPDAATLNGTILTEVYLPLTYNSLTGQSSSYLVTVTASVVLTDPAGKVLYKNDHFLFRSQYEETADLSSFIQEDRPAVYRMANEFAQSLVSDIMESF